jgi:hypothetical protein
LVLGLVALTGASVGARTADALPSGPQRFCETYNTSPLCRASAPPCVLCHTSLPSRNGFGAAVEAGLPAGTVSQAQFDAQVAAALRAIESADSDGDGVSNIDEINAGTFPGNETSFPDPGGCETQLTNPRYQICTYDRAYVFRRVNIDFCGIGPTYEDVQRFAALAPAAQEAELDRVLDTCLTSEHWVARDGVLWNLAYRKVRPIQALKSGEGAGLFPLGDYFDDLNYFVWVSTGDRDVREMLTGTYYVTRSMGPQTVYTRVEDLAQHFVPLNRRAGMLTQRWFLVYFIMFSPLQRTMAAQAYRVFLGLDIALLEGLYPIANEPVDYDLAGVQAPACAGCHSTLDPLTYPFRDYDGIQGGVSFPGTPFGSYMPNRMTRLWAARPGTLGQSPEAGYIFGQRVANLQEWAQVAANSDAFAAAMVGDYWNLLIGRRPEPGNAEYQALWQGLGPTDNYRVRAMLRRLIRTEAYGVP